MTIEKMFEVATRTKMRFPFKGLISVEDLWDLSSKNLDSIFKNLNAELKQVTEESLLDAKTKEDQDLDIKISIVKYIFNVKSEEQNARLREKEQAEHKQKILKLISEKQDQDLHNKSIDELQSMLSELEK